MTMTATDTAHALLDLLRSIWWDGSDIEANEMIDWIDDPYGGLSDEEALWLAWDALTGGTAP